MNAFDDEIDDLVAGVDWSSKGKWKERMLDTFEEKKQWQTPKHLTETFYRGMRANFLHHSDQFTDQERLQIGKYWVENSFRPAIKAQAITDREALNDEDKARNERVMERLENCRKYGVAKNFTNSGKDREGRGLTAEEYGKLTNAYYDNGLYFTDQVMERGLVDVEEIDAEQAKRVLPRTKEEIKLLERVIADESYETLVESGFYEHTNEGTFNIAVSHDWFKDKLKKLEKQKKLLEYKFN